MKFKFPVIEPWLGREEKKLLAEVIDSGWITEHAMTRRFEELLRRYTGARYVLAVNNGTSALFMALKAVGIKPGDEVLVPDLTFIATANAVILAGAKPVLVDVEPETLGIDVKKAERKITQRTRAIIPVHLYGITADITGVLRLARRHRLFVIEDAAQGMGVRYKNKHAGTFGDLGIISFYGNKTITCGEGAALLTDDEKLYRACYRLKNHGRDKRGSFVHPSVGYNFSFTEMQAAVGIAQLKKLGKIIKMKKRIYNIYRRILSKVRDCKFLPVPSEVKPVFWFTNIFIPDAGKLSIFLAEHGVPSRRFFYPLHMQTCYKRYRFGRSYPVSISLYQHGLSLPSAVTTPLEEIERAAKLVRRYFQ